MEGIPPARDTDVEDVVWALQTAEALWRRNERGDALVWLRRAAQAAGEANDDDRAFALARKAAELTEWMSRSSAAVPPASPSSEPSSSDIDSLLRSSQPDEAPDTEPPVYLGSSSSSRPPVPMRVLSAAESHAGMLDPWSEIDEKKAAPAIRAQAPTAMSSASDARGVTATEGSEDEVITSVKVAPAPVAVPVAKRAPVPRSSIPSPRSTSPWPPPSGPAPRVPKPSTSPRPKSQSPAPTVSSRAAKPPIPPPPSTEPSLVSEAEADTPRTPQLEEGAVPPLDLSGVEAFADLPDDAQGEFARAASLRRYTKGEEVEPFALALVVRGSVDVMASDRPMTAAKVRMGGVLCARGTLDEPIPLRLVCVSEALVATWSADAMRGGLGPCPWVEDDLRAAGDRVQALAGSTLGVMGQKLSLELRTSIVERLTIHIFSGREAIVTEGVPVPGLLLVGAGRVDVVSDEAAPTQLGAGEFVLPAEALSAGASPATVRAAPGGALLLVGDRKTTQELFATEPLLLEIFAGW